MRFSVSTPISNCCVIKKLRIIKPAPTSNTIVRPICPTSNTSVILPARLPLLPLRPPSLRFSLTFDLEICSAGARPNKMPVKIETAAKYANTR